jgi:uncharacterized membrane protein YdjX (TVP38/TMEM64 family)
MTRRNKRILLLVLLVALIVIARYAGVGEYLTLDNLRRHREALEQFVRERYAASAAGYIVVYLMTTALALPGAAVLTMAGGFLFGTVPGVIYSNVGATGGAIINFLLARYVAGSWLQGKYAGQLERFNRELERNGHLYLLTLRFIPLFPFFLINLCAGLTRIPLRTFAWTTLVGILPGGLVFAFAGSQLNTIRSVEDVFSGRVLAALLLLAAFALVPIVWKKLKAR